jgi:hypothetical protein
MAPGRSGIRLAERCTVISFDRRGRREPNAELRELEGVSHNLKMNVLAPVLAEFFTGEKDVPVQTGSRPATA